MKIIVIAAVTIDGFIGHTKTERLNLSSAEDLNHIMRLRDDCDAILVGAETIRRDDSTLITRDKALIEYRRGMNKCADPIKVTLTRTGNIPIESNFIKYGHCQKIVYASGSIEKSCEERLSKVVTLKKLNTKNIMAKQIVADLSREGVKTLIVEGGTTILTMFFEENIVDELRLSVVPFFVGVSKAPRLLNPGNFKFNGSNRMQLTKIQKLGDTAVMNFTLKLKS